MGRHIDRAALWALGTIGLYLFFLNAWGSVPAACLAAFACCALVRRLLASLPRRRRMPLSRARAELMRMASLPDGEAARALSGLVKRRYPDEEFTLCPVLKHPEASLSCGDVLSAWKACRDADRLVIAATCPCEPRAAAYARELRQPRVAVLDSRALLRLLRREPWSGRRDAPTVPLRQRLRRAAARALATGFSPRNLALAAALLALYLLGGSPLSLFAALALLAHAALILHRRGPGRRLFDG